MTAGLTEPVHRAIASRLRRGQTTEQLMSVGERTGWWTADDVDWADSGGQGPRPDGWTLDTAPTQPAEPWEYRDGQYTEPAAVAAGLLQEARASVALDGETHVVGGGVCR